jgi:CRP/FNR family transcriptional regulator, anaerobic regulatory protein
MHHFDTLNRNLNARPHAKTGLRRERSLRDGPVLQTVATGTALFRPGDERCVYRVETGSLSQFMQWHDGRHEVLEFAFPGDIIGIGHLSIHVSSAHAMVDSVVSLLGEAEFKHELEANDVLALRLTAAAEREFDYMGGRAHRLVAVKPDVRLASYLSALARMNDREGRGPTFISDMNCTPYVAELLQVDVSTLAKALANLHKRGLVAPVEGGLTVVDVAALERFADAA